MVIQYSQPWLFQSTHSVRSATLLQVVFWTKQKVSIHALRTECDSEAAKACAVCEVSIHALHTECDTPLHPTRQRRYVSIHALHTECDGQYCNTHGNAGGFNPRTPYGVRPLLAHGSSRQSVFQFTHSIRSATMHLAKGINVQDVSIHALHTECDTTAGALIVPVFVSIHALHTECDLPSSVGR